MQILKQVCPNTAPEIIFSVLWNIICSIVSCFSFFMRCISPRSPGHHPATVPVKPVLPDAKEFPTDHGGFMALSLRAQDLFAAPDTRGSIGLIK